MGGRSRTGPPALPLHFFFQVLLLYIGFFAFEQLELACFVKRRGARGRAGGPGSPPLPRNRHRGRNHRLGLAAVLPSTTRYSRHPPAPIAIIDFAVLLSNRGGPTRPPVYHRFGAASRLGSRGVCAAASRRRQPDPVLDPRGIDSRRSKLSRDRVISQLGRPR